MVSSNIVGYNKIDLGKGFNLVGSQFVNVGATDKTINDLVAANELMPMTAEFAFQTKLQVWDGQKYLTYGWCDATSATAMEMQAWADKWLEEDFSGVATTPAPAGTGFWIESSDVASMTIAGEVPEDDTTEIEVSGGFTLLAYPYPETVSIQKIQSDDLAGMTPDFAFQSKLQVWDGSKYITYGWCDADDGTAMGMASWNSTWLHEDYSETTAADDIAIGAGFWIDTPSSATIRFTK